MNEKKATKIQKEEKFKREMKGKKQNRKSEQK